MSDNVREAFKKRIPPGCSVRWNEAGHCSWLDAPSITGCPIDREWQTFRDGWIAAVEWQSQQAQGDEGIIGDMVSIDISTCDEDSDHRVFGHIVEHQPGPDGGRIWLCTLDQFNYARPPAPAAQQAQGEPVAWLCEWNDEDGRYCKTLNWSKAVSGMDSANVKFTRLSAPATAAVPEDAVEVTDEMVSAARAFLYVG